MEVLATLKHRGPCGVKWTSLMDRFSVQVPPQELCMVKEVSFKEVTGWGKSRTISSARK